MAVRTQRCRSGRPAALLVALLAAVSCWQTLAQTPAPASGVPDFVTRDTLSSFYAHLYGIPVPYGVPDPDILITLTVIGAGDADLYCNPRWGEYTQVATNFPQPGFAVWFSDYSQGVDQVFISKNDPLYRPPGARNPNTTAYKNYHPSFICSVINVDANNRVEYRLEANLYAPAQSLATLETAAIKNIWDSCCSGFRIGAPRCATWAAANEAAGELVTNFCDFEGQYCTDSGRLQRLDLTGYNMSCPFPTSDILAFTALSTLNLGQNPEITGNVGMVLDQLSTLTNLTTIQLTSNTGMTGPLQPAGKTGLCKLAQNSLVQLDVSKIGLNGTLPSCLIGNNSLVTELMIGENNLTGTIPDVIQANSPLEVFSAGINLFSGTVPAGFAKASGLSTLDLSNNQLSGSIPPTLGNIKPLKNVLLKFNNLSGMVPPSLAYATNLETLDLKNNSLSQLPPEWVNPGAVPGSLKALRNSTLVTIRLSFNQFTGFFPAGFGYMNVSFLMLNSNNFSGPLPDTPGMFRQLRALNISNNSFTGTLPASFGKSGIFTLSPLEYTNGNLFQHVFDVSYNKLSGSLPSFLNQTVVPAYTQGGIYLAGNNLNITCIPNVTSYLQDVCAAPTLRIASPGVAPATAGASSSSGGSSSTGVIVGVIAGVIAAIALAAGATFFYLRRKRRQTHASITPGFHGIPAFLPKWPSANGSSISGSTGKFQRYRPDASDGMELPKHQPDDDEKLLNPRI